MTDLAFAFGLAAGIVIGPVLIGVGVWLREEIEVLKRERANERCKRHSMFGE